VPIRRTIPGELELGWIGRGYCCSWLQRGQQMVSFSGGNIVGVLPRYVRMRADSLGEAGFVV
jgi:hypothetical protein